MKATWKDEFERFYFSLYDSKNEQDKELKLAMESTMYNEALSQKLLELYIDACNLKHLLQFLQFRRIVPDVNQDQIKKIFENRKAYVLKIHDKVCNMIKRGRIESKTQMKDL